MERNISMNISSDSIDKAIEKVNQLIKLLREAQEIADSLFTK